MLPLTQSHIRVQSTNLSGHSQQPGMAVTILETKAPHVWERQGANIKRAIRGPATLLIIVHSFDRANNNISFNIRSNES